MKKIYLLFAAMLLTAVSAWAQKRYEAVGFNDYQALENIETGVQVCLQKAAQADPSFLNINAKNAVKMSSIIDEYGVFEFVGGANGQYFLRSVATGKYIENPVYSEGVLRLTDSQLRAASFICEHPYQWQDVAAVDTARKYEFEEYSYTTFTTDELYGLEDFCFKFTANTANGLYMLTYNAAAATWNQTYNNNTWGIYRVQEKDAYGTLVDIFTELCPKGRESLNIFIPGTDPGKIDEAVVQEMNDAYDEAEELVNSISDDEAACRAALERLQRAYDACINGIHPMRSGYFYFSNWRTQSTQGNPIEDNAVYENDNNQTVWTWQDGWVRPETPTAKDARYIYYIIDNGDGTFYLQNFYTKRYLGFVSGNNKRIPTTEGPEEKIRISIHPTQPGMFSVVSTSRENATGQDAIYPAMHAAGDYNAIVYWTIEADASAWYFNEIPADKIAGIEHEIEQEKINAKLAALISEAEVSYAKGFTYASDATKDSNYDESKPGLVTDMQAVQENGQIVSGQMWSNAPDSEEGTDYAAMSDGSLLTFWHSDWHGTLVHPEATYPNLVVDLGEALDILSVKYSARVQNAIGAPTRVHFYATNDTTGWHAGDYSRWIDQGIVGFDYPYQAIVTNEAGEELTYNNATGIASCVFNGKYRFVRMDVEATRSNGKANGGHHIYFNLSEIRFYKGTYDRANSLIEVVDPTVRSTFENTLTAAKAALEAGTATQATIDDMQAAYDQFLANYPDPQRVKDLLAEARAQAAAAEEGNAMGYFKTGAKQELEAAIASVEGNVKDVMSLAEVNAAIATLQAALDVFNAKLIKPVDGAFYRIKSATSSEAAGSAANNYLYAQDNGPSGVKWGGFTTAGEDPNLSSRLNYIWKVEVNEDGSYNFLNAATGTYMATTPENRQAIKMAVGEETPTAMTLRSAKLGGLFNIVQAEGVYANAEPGSKNLVTWGSADGADNSAFQFVEADWSGGYYVDVATPNLVPMTFPYAIEAPEEAEATAYKVLGYREAAPATRPKFGAESKNYELVLGKYNAGDIISAATPFVLQRTADVTGVNFYLDGVSTIGQVSYTFETAAQNGLYGVLAPVKAEAGVGYFRDGMIFIAKAGDTIPANSAFLDDVTETAETGDVAMPMEGLVGTAIAAPVMTNPQSSSHIYDLSGRRVQTAKAGLYIINGRKVLVK